MDKLLGALLAALVLGGALTGMIRSWRRRVQRDAHITVQRELPTSESRWTGRLQYVATTPLDDPINRLAIPSLAFRGFAQLDITHAGVIVRVDGEAPVAIPAAQLVSVQPASWVIDRGVGEDGLIRLTWKSVDAQPVSIDSYFRVSEPADRAAVLETLASLIPTATSPSEPA